MKEDESQGPALRIGPTPEGEILLGTRELTKFFPPHREWSESVLHPLQEEQVAVVEKVTLDVRTGESFGILGLDGSGKTTLLRMIAGELLPDGGSATVAGCDVALQAEEVRRVVQWIPGEEGALDPEQTARAHLEQASASHHRVSEWNEATFDPASQGRVDEVLQLVRLHDDADRKVAIFSAGMKRRLTLARALLFRPLVLLLDEPTRGLERRAAQEFRDILRSEPMAREKCTLLLATREPQEAFELCHRVGIMHRGHLLAVRTPEAYRETMGTEWYRLWMQQTGLDSLMALTGHRDIKGFRSHAAGMDGWAQVEVEIPGGMEAAARVLGSLTAGGIRIARFERVGLNLPQLIERLDVSTSSRPEERESEPGSAMNDVGGSEAGILRNQPRDKDAT